MNGDISPEAEAQIQEAFADPASFSVTITGRNGYKVTHNFNLHTWETGTISSVHEVNRRQLDVFYPGDGAFREPLPYRRVITYTLETGVR